jgi:hypothetical protein
MEPADADKGTASATVFGNTSVGTASEARALRIDRSFIKYGATRSCGPISLLGMVSGFWPSVRRS